MAELLFVNTYRMGDTMTFNPEEHLTQLKSKQGSQDYLEVKWRMVWFRDRYPNGTIETEEVEVDLDRVVEAEAFVWNAEKRRSEKVLKQAKGYARFRCVVTNGDGGKSTGTKSESAVNFPDFIEKAETGAIGRALAGLGFGTQFTGDELAEGHRIVDSPVDSHPSRNTAASNSTQGGQQYALRPSDLAEIRSKWAVAYRIPESQIEERWPKYLRYLLKIDEPALKTSHIEIIERDSEIQTAKLRVKDLDMHWDDAKRDAGLMQVYDNMLTPANIASLNSVIDQWEKRASLAPAS